MPEFQYAIRRPALGQRPGHHRSVGPGGGFEFLEHAPLSARSDPRRLDLYASCRRPFGDLVVRVLREQRAICVHVLADLSGSMGFQGVRRKLDVLAEFVDAAARSAHRIGDGFGFIGAGATVIEELTLPPTRRSGAGDMLAARLRLHRPSGASADGLLEAAGRLGRHPALVFVVSDFHFPLAHLAALLGALAAHTVVPVVVWDRAETEPPDAWGLSAVRDLETGEQRLLFNRPALRSRIRAAWQARRTALDACCLRHGVHALHLPDGFDAERITRHFLDPHAAAT